MKSQGGTWKVNNNSFCLSILFKAKYGMKKAQLGSKKVLFIDCGLCKFGQALNSFRQALIMYRYTCVGNLCIIF